jgi:hypothetical protein
MLRVILKLHQIVVSVRAPHPVPLGAAAHPPDLLQGLDHARLSQRCLIFQASLLLHPPLLPLSGIRLSSFWSSIPALSRNQLPTSKRVRKKKGPPVFPGAFGEIFETARGL